MYLAGSICTESCQYAHLRKPLHIWTYRWTATYLYNSLARVLSDTPSRCDIAMSTVFATGAIGPNVCFVLCQLGYLVTGQFELNLGQSRIGCEIYINNQLLVLNMGRKQARGKELAIIQQEFGFSRCFNSMETYQMVPASHH